MNPGLWRYENGSIYHDPERQGIGPETHREGTPAQEQRICSVDLGLNTDAGRGVSESTAPAGDMNTYNRMIYQGPAESGLTASAGSFFCSEIECWLINLPYI